MQLLIPLSDHVVVRTLDQEEEPDGSPIVLPESVEQEMLVGKVLSVGDGHLLPDGRRVPLEVHEGDRVLFPHYAGQTVQVNGRRLRILREADILAVL